MDVIVSYISYVPSNMHTLQKGACRHIHSVYILVLRVTIKGKHIYPRAVFRKK